LRRKKREEEVRGGRRGKNPLSVIPNYATGV
jgi:hypothetical protein